MAIPFGIIGVLLFTTPDVGATGKLIYTYVTYKLIMMAYTAINVPYASLLGVMTPDPNMRTTLASYRMVFAFGGSLLVVAIYQPLVDFFKTTTSVTTAYQLVMVVIGAGTVILFFFTFAWTKERVTPPKSQQNSLKDDF